MGAEMKHLVIGCGEVGKALKEVFQCPGHDPAAGIFHAEPCDMMHVSIPYSPEKFEQAVREYHHQFQPTFIVIHSTVPIGTSDSLNAHHSPVRGKHPYLADSIRSFVKYVGGPQAEVICEELRKFGINAVTCESARDTEAGKLLDLMQYGASVLIEKEIHEFCVANSLDFDLVYRQFNETYNAGYAARGDGHFRRPVLEHKDGPIGGHCVVQNMRWVDTFTARMLTVFNERLYSQKQVV
jgi:hypothetical protein